MIQRHEEIMTQMLIQREQTLAKLAVLWKKEAAEKEVKAILDAFCFMLRFAFFALQFFQGEV